MKYVTCFKCQESQEIENYSIKWKCPKCFPVSNETPSSEPKFYQLKDVKPDRDCQAWVTNERFGSMCWMAYYNKTTNCFTYSFDNQLIAVDVTHWHYLADAWDLSKTSHM